MKYLLIGLSLLMLVSCSSRDLEMIEGYMPLTEEEVSEALKDALSRGVSISAAKASKVDGFYASPQLKIGFPQDAGKLERALRKIGLGEQLDQFELQLNRSAELAAKRAKRVFIKQITAMTIDDAFDILNGPPDAATRYLIDNSRAELYEAFRPIVSDALDETLATRYYAKIVKRYNALPGAFHVDPDLVGYTTGKAIDGLFVLVAEEEARIRAVSSARTTRVMKRVFGSLD